MNGELAIYNPRSEERAVVVRNLDVVPRPATVPPHGGMVAYREGREFYWNPFPNNERRPGVEFEEVSVGDPSDKINYFGLENAIRSLCRIEIILGLIVLVFEMIGSYGPNTFFSQYEYIGLGAFAPTVIVILAGARTWLGVTPPDVKGKFFGIILHTFAVTFSVSLCVVAFLTTNGEMGGYKRVMIVLMVGQSALAVTILGLLLILERKMFRRERRDPYEEWIAMTRMA